MKKSLTILLATALLPCGALAAEKVSGQNFMVYEQQNIKIDAKSGYWIWHGKGISRRTMGAQSEAPIACDGAGFWGKNGPRGEGVCVHDAGENTWTITWEHKEGSKEGSWIVRASTGKYRGISGAGTYVSKRLPGNRQITEWKGAMTLPK